VSYADHDPTRCAFDDKPADSTGICPRCWQQIQKPLAVIKASKAEVRDVLAEAPEELRADLEEQGDLLKPEPAFHAVLVGLLHVALAVEYGDSAIDTVANRVDSGKLVIASVYNLSMTLGYKNVAEKLLRARLGEPHDLIRFRDPGKGVFQVHTPYNERWNVLARENRQIFFTAPEKDGSFWWRTFHRSELRRVANLLQGVYGDQLTLGLNGKLFALPSMPLPKEDDFGKAPSGKPKATGERLDVPEEIEGIRLGDRIKLPGGGESIVQFIDPRKKSIGVGDTKEGRYTFFSFDIVETENGRPIAARLFAERKQAAKEVGGGPVEDVLIDRSIPAGMKNYQIESVAFIEKHRRVILGDEQGLGKTLVSITCIDAPAVIVCPATLKNNWVEEIAKWRPELTPFVISGGETPSIADRKRANVFIINYDIVDKHLDWLVKIGAKTLVADEAQYLKNLGVRWDSKLKDYAPTDASPRRAKAFYDLHRTIPKLILATGTPVMNRTKELFPLLHLCNKQEWNNQTRFQERYCGAFEKDTPRGKVWDANGRTNSDELHTRIVESYLIRHTKAMVLTELPPKMRTSILVPLSEKWRRAHVQLTRDFLAWVYAHGGPEKVAKASRAEALTRLTAMRRLSANGKVEAALEWIHSFLESTGFRPLIVMGVHADAFRALGKGLDAINAKFDEDVAAGEMPSISRKIRWESCIGTDGLGKRVKVTSRFQKTGDIDVLLFSIPLATGLTLTRSQDMLFLERLWRPADQVQAEDRCVLEGELVLTETGWRPIETIRVGDHVLTHRGRFRQVTKTHHRQHRDLVTEITYRRFNKPLRVTHDHKVFVKRGGKLMWVQAHAVLPRRDKLVMPRWSEPVQKIESLSFPEHLRHDATQVNQKNGRYVPMPATVAITDAVLALFGWYLAEGFTSTKRGKGSFVSLAGHERDLPALKRHGKTLTDTFGVTWSIYKTKGKGIELRAYSREMAAWFAHLFGTGSRNKEIPRQILRGLSNEKLNVLLSSYIAGDGYKRRKATEAVSVSPHLASQALLIMGRLGFSPTARLVSEGDNAGQWIVGYTKDPTPSSIELLDADDRYVYHPVSAVSTCSGQALDGYGVEGAKKYPVVYDLTVEGDHTFVVGNAVVHNCHRIGQRGSVHVTYLDGVGTIDQKMGLLLMDKSETAAEVIDGEELSHAESFFRVFGEMIDKDGKKMDPSKFHSGGTLSDLIEEAELEAIDMAQSLDELVKARQVMEKQKTDLRDIKMSEGMTFEEATAAAGQELDEDIEEFARKLRAKRDMKPNRAEAFEAGELYPGHAEDHAYYMQMRRQHLDFDEILDSMVVDSWNNPLP
jgi:intein/homing endonuclease